MGTFVDGAFEVNDEDFFEVPEDVNYTPAVQSDPYAPLFEGDPSSWMSTAMEPETKMPAAGQYPWLSLQLANVTGPIAEGAAKGAMGIPDLLGMAYNYATPDDWSKAPRLGEVLARALYPEDLKRAVEEERRKSGLTAAIGSVADVAGTTEEFLSGGGAFSGTANLVGKAGKIAPTLSKAGNWMGQYGKGAQALDAATGTIAGIAGELGGEKAKTIAGLAPTAGMGALGLASKIPYLSKIPGLLGNSANAIAEALTAGKVNPKEAFLNYLSKYNPDARSLLTKSVDEIAAEKALEAANLGVRTGVGNPDLSAAEAAAAGERSLLEGVAREIEDPTALTSLKPLEGEASARATRELSPFTMDEFGDKLARPAEELGSTLQKEVQALDTIEHARVNSQLDALSSTTPVDAGAVGTKAVKDMQDKLTVRLEDNPVLRKDPDFREVIETIRSWKPGRKWSENSLKNLHSSLSQLQRKLPGGAGELAGELLAEVKNIAGAVNPKLLPAWEDYAKYVEKFRSPDRNITSRLAAGNTDMAGKKLSAFESFSEASIKDSSHFTDLARTIGPAKARDFYKRRLALDLEDRLSKFARSAPEGGSINDMHSFATDLLQNKAMLKKVYGKNDYRKIVDSLESLKKSAGMKDLADKLNVEGFTPLSTMRPVEAGMKVVPPGAKNSPLFFYTNTRRLLGLLYGGKQQAVNREVFNTLGQKHGLSALTSPGPATRSSAEVARGIGRQALTQWEVMADALGLGESRKWIGDRGESPLDEGVTFGEPEQKKKLTEIDMSASDKSLQQALGLRDKVVRAESSGNPKAVSPKDAKGLMQLTDIAIRDVAQEYGMDPSELDVFNGEQNKEWGTKFLAMMLDRFGGDEKLALAAYNMGPTALRKMLDKYDVSTWDELEKKMSSKSYTETRDYVAKIMKAGNVG